MKILPPTWLLLTLIMMLVLHFTLPGAAIPTGAWRLIGLLPILAGITLDYVADGQFHRAGTTIRPDGQPRALITQGCYRLSRNPMYLGFVLVLLGAALMLGSLTPFILVPAFAILMDRIFIQKEEVAMQNAFGGEWLAYKRRVRRWI